MTNAPAPLDPTRDRLWAMLAHLSGILSVLGPLIIWLVFRGRGAEVDRNGKEALNFQLTIVLVNIAAQIAGWMLAIIGIGFLILGLAWLVQVAGIVFAIVAAIRTNQTGDYRYPLALRLIR